MSENNGQRPVFMWTSREVSAIMVDANGQHTGRSLTENCIISGKPPKDFVRFYADIRTKIGETPEGKTIIRTRSGNIIPGKTAAEAFVNLEEMIPKVCEQIRKDAFAEANAPPKPDLVIATELPPGLPPWPGPGMTDPQRPRRRR